MTERAAALYEAGYSAIPTTKQTNAHTTRPVLGRFTVVSPAGDTYAVDVFAGRCECVCWRRNRTCKHLRGVGRLAFAQAYAEQARWQGVRCEAGRRRMWAADLLLRAAQLTVQARQDMARERAAMEAGR